MKDNKYDQDIANEIKEIAELYTQRDDVEQQIRYCDKLKNPDKHFEIHVNINGSNQRNCCVHPDQRESIGFNLSFTNPSFNYEWLLLQIRYALEKELDYIHDEIRLKQKALLED